MIQRIPYPLPAKRQRPKSGIERAPKRVWLRHRKFVRSHACVVPGCQASDIQFCHIRSAATAGTGMKPHDAHSFPACFNHHQEQHQIGQGTFEDRYGLDLEAIAAELVRKSPDTQIRLQILGVGDPAPGLGPARPGAADPAARTEATAVTAGRDRHPNLSQLNSGEKLEQAGPQMATGSREPRRPSCNPRSRVAATHNAAEAVGEANEPMIRPPTITFRLAGPYSRLCRIVWIEGRVS